MSRFLRFFRVFVVAIICGFGALSANATNTSSITVCDDFSDAGNACVRFDSANAGAPTSFTTPLNNNTKLTAFPYKPGYGYAGHYTGRNCGGTQILNHLGEWMGNSATGGGNIYACWVPLTQVYSANADLNKYVFVLSANGGESVGNYWDGCGVTLPQTGVLNAKGINPQNPNISVRYDNRGDWMYLSKNGSNSVWWALMVIYPDKSTSFYNLQDGYCTYQYPSRAGYVFGGFNTSGGLRAIDATGTSSPATLVSIWNGGNVADYNVLNARWNAMTVNLSGNYATPGTVYFDGSSWYSDAGATSPISGVTVSSNGNYVFGGYWTGENGTGVKVIDEDGYLRTGTDVANAIYNEIILQPHWVASSTWATLSINNQDSLRSVWKLYYPLSGCSIPGYHTSQDCLNTNVVTSLANWTGHWPEKDGWVYGGHWTGTDGTNLDGSQNPYIGTDGALLRTITNPTTVYAKWSFSVAYAAGTSTGGSAPSGPIVCTYGTTCNAPENTYTNTNSNMQFAGWACSLVGATGSCAKTKYAAGESLLGATNNVSGATGITLTATWTSNITYYKLTLDSRSGFGGNKPPYIYEGYNAGFYKENNDTNRITASIFAPLADGGAGIAQPTKAGYAFYGYWTGVNDGEQIIDRYGIIQVGPDRFTSATTLYAHWLDNVETVPLDLGEHGSWGTCGVTSIQVVPGEPPLESQLSCVPTADAEWNFIGYYDSDSNNATQYYDANGYAVYPDNVWPISNAPTRLVARYEAITHTVNYYCKKGNGPNVLARTDHVRNGDQYTVWNGEGVPACANTAATSGNNGQGSKLVGWGNGNTGNSGTMAYSAGANFDSFTITDDRDLSMVQKPIYYVTLNHCNDSSCSSYPVSNIPNPSTVYFSNGNWYSDALATAPMTVMNPKPDRLGYTFGGYNTESNGSGTTVVDNSGAFVTGDNIHANSSTIYAQWTVLQRQINLVRDGGDGGPESLWHQIDKWSLNQGGDSIVRITPPTKSNNSFAGYWIKDGGEFVRKVIDSNGDILFFGQNAAELIDGMAEPRKFYARWDDMPSAPTNPNEYFAVTTIELSAGDTFKFGMSAAGSFYVDWGDGTVVPIVRDNTNPTVYSHTYTTSGSKTIKIWAPQNGGATMYNSGCYSTISFGWNETTPEFVAGIYGSLGAVFPTINGGVNDADIPSFSGTFSRCSNLVVDIGNLGNLFSGVTGTRAIMFMGLFDGCPGVTGAIPAGFFSGISGPVKEGCALGMFQSAFRNTGVTSIPAGLFNGLSGIGWLLFEETFSGTGITSIPDGLFSTITTTNSAGSTYRTFGETFKNTALEALPQNLFGTIVINEDQQATFVSMFQGNGDLSGYVPKTLFAPITDNTSGPGTNSIMSTIFLNTPNLATSCDSYGLTEYTTGFESYWGDWGEPHKVSCAPAAVFSCVAPGNIGTGTPPNPIFVTPVDSGSVSFTFPSGANCTAPHYTKNNTWTCNGNVCNNGATSWSSNGQTPFNGTWNGQQSVTFYMTYTPDVYTIVLNQNHSSNDNTTVSGSPIKERYGDTWLDSNGVILDPQKAPVPSSWTNNNTTYNFKGYFTSRSGGTRMTTNDGTFVNDAATHTVGSDGTWYAQWDDSNNVTFKCEEGGSAINGYSFSDVQSGDSINVPATSVCTKTGYTFTQWKIVANGVLIDETNNGGTYAWNYNFGSDVVPDWQLVETTITLDKHGGTGGTSALYTRYGVGVYRDSDRTQEMKTGENPLTAPSKSVTLTLSLNDVSDDPDDPRARVVVNNQVYTGSVGLPYDLGFKGYYSSASSTTKYIESTGFITAGSNGGMQTGAGYTSDMTWHAQWNPSTVVSTGNMPVPTWAGHVFNGWWTAESGGIQITDGTGAFVGDGSVPTINANTTWHAQWTGCSHDFGSNPHAGKEPLTAVDGMCGYHITCDTNPGVPLGAGYSQHGGNDTTGAFDFYILPSSTDTLPGCSPRVYDIQYALMGVSATLPQSGTPQTYTYGVGGSITGVPSSVGSEFVAWCTDAGLSSCVSSSPYYTIGATDYGDRIYYAKWSADCRNGYMKYNYDVTVTADYDNQSHFYPAGVCAPGNYIITCDNNCPVGETCNACLENILSSSYHFGQRYGVYSQKFGNSQETYDGVVGALGIVLGSQNYNWTFPFGASSYIRPAYSLTGIGDWVDNMNLPSSSVFGQNDYAAYMTNLAQLNGKTFGRAHYSFNGLWTHQTSEEEQYRYLPTVNDTTPWSQRNADGKALSKFFTSNATVYAHWIPDVYTITLNANGGVLGNVTVLKEKWNTGWSKDNGASYQTATNFVALTDAERPVWMGHTFAGYYTERQTQVGQDCPGTKIVNSDGSLNASASSSPGMTVGNAKYFGANGSTLYACWTANNYYVTLKPNLGTGAHGTSSDTTIYTKYMTGVYTNSGRTLKMKPNPNGENPVTLPTRYFTITYNPNYTGGSTWNSDPVLSTFNGYYSSATGGTPYIDNTGYITSTGDSTAQGYTVNTKEWHAQWTNGSHDLLLTHHNGYFMDGWYDAAENGNKVGEYMGTITPTSNMTLYAHWTACDWDAGDHSTAQYVAPLETDGNVCKYHITCDSGYTHNGNSQFDEVKYSASGTTSLPGCSANEYTITYYDNPAYETTSGQHILLDTQGYTYNPSNPVVLNPELSSNALSDHRASSVQWCDVDGNNCKTQLAAGETGNKTFYAKWTCATGYRTYAYVTDTNDYDTDVHVWPAGTCAPSRYRIMCNKNCPTYQQNGQNVTEICNACLEDFKLLSSSDTIGKYSFGSVYNGMAIGQTSCDGMVAGDLLPVPIYEKNNPTDARLFTKNPDSNYEFEACWVQRSDALFMAYGSGNYKTFMEALADQSYNSSINLNFGATHYDFDGLWTAASGGEQYISANGLSPEDEDAFNTQEMSKFFTSDTDVYAHWEPKVYPITLCPENGTSCSTGGGMSGGGKLYQKWSIGWRLGSNGNFKVAAEFNNNPISIPTYDGYNFMGYYTEQQTGTSCQGTRIINADGKLNTDVSDVVAATQFENGTTLYACWQSSAYTVTYNCGDGTGNGSVDNTPRYGQSYTPKAYADVNCERPSNGYYFNGWNVTPGHSNSDIKYAGDAFNWDYTENQTFTARWVAKEYHITFNKNGGSGGTNEVWERYGESTGFWRDAVYEHITTITLPNWSGHTFAGYAFNGNTVISGTTLPDPTFDFGDTSNNSTVDITLVAQWDANTYNVRYNLDGGTTTLPVGYVPVEYITFTGTQVIDTGLKIKKGYEIQTKFYPTDTGRYVYGALSSGNSKSVTGYVSTSGDNWRWGNKAIVKSMSLNSITYTIVQNASALTVNGVPVAYGTQDNFETGVTLSIGKAHNASGGTSYDASGFKGRMYWFTIRDDNGNVVYHGVPVKNTANNQYGLCNIIDGTCLTASGINGATATLPATYNHGTATTVSGAAARANSVFNSWCSSPSSNCNSAQTIPATATGDKTFYAKWTCDAGYSYSSGGACVANNITLDWNENGGIGLTNGSCTYNGDLTLGVAPTYAGHVFNGWKLANNTYGGASTTVNGGCVQAYTGVTSGTSTAITAQWCNACNPTNATCTLNANTPGTCSYTTSCNTGYHLSPDSQLNVYNTVCIPYTITYQSDGHGDGATGEVLYNSTFTTNDAKNSSQFNWNNHIVTAWTTVSGGNFPNLGAEYTYNVQSDTVLKANWGQCHCTAGTGATNCNTTSSNNECEVNVITCNTGFTGSTWSCDGINCTASCNNDNRHTITLNKNNGTGGTTTLYTIYGTGSDAGVYINSARTNRMTPNPDGTYPITAPTLSRTVSYDITSNGTVSNASFAQQPTSANTSAVATFNGYYDSITGTEQYIEDDGYINATGVSMGKGYTTNKTWYAQWTDGSVTLPNAYRPGYTLSGWSTTVGGASVGNAGDAYTTGSNVTLYPVWTQCAAGTYCPGVETVNNSPVYNQIHNCPTNYSNSAAGSTMISDCYLVLTPGKYVSTAGNGMSICQQNYYCDGNGINVYYSDAANDGRVTTWAQKSCAANAGSFSLTDGMGKTSINACYKNVTLNKRGGNGTLGGASGINDGSTPCGYNQNCTLPDASILQLTGHTFHGGWSQTDADCNSTTRVFVVPDEVSTYYACRTPNTYTVTLKDGLDENRELGTIEPTYGAAMPSVDSNGNPLTVPTKIGVANTIYDFAGYYNVAQTQGASPTAYYNYDLTSATNWTNTTGGTLYAWWNVTCAPGYYLPAGATSCVALCPSGEYCPGNTQILYYSVPSSSNQGIASDHIAAGYYSTGGASTATPIENGNGCVGENTACGLVAGGYYSTGGGKVSAPTNSNGCLSGFSCGVLGADYYSNGGGTNNAGACVTGQTCGACPTKYRSNTDTAKTVITQCTAACGAGTQVATAETTTNNGCKTPLGNTWWSNAHTVAYGSASPTVTGVNEYGVHTCANYYKTPNTEVADNHNEQKDCARSVRLLKNGGITVDGAQWPENVVDMNTSLAQATCQEGESCAFGNPAELLAQTGYTFQNRWGTDSECANPVVSPITTLVGARYYACKVKNNYTLTYACGTGATGDAPNQQTNIHYGDTVSVSGAGGCAKTGHTFAGWTVSGTSDVITATTWPHNITWNYDGSKTFTAQWTANTYSISYVGNGGTAGSILPDGYTQLEYIESNGNQYIVTNFIPSSDFKHTIVFEGLSGNSNNYIAGTVASAAGRAGNVRINGSYINGVFGNDTSNSAAALIDTTKTGGMSVLNGKSVLVLDLHNNATNSITLNGVQVANTSTARITSTAPMNLFALDSNYRSKIRLYSDIIEQDGALVHNYVPAQNSDGVVGLYDTVTGVFLTNRGSGSFTPGNPVTAAYPNQYTYGVGATVTGGATRANSVFQGWCRTASLTNCAAPHEITTTDTGDMTLYAKWGCATGYHNVNNQCVANEFTLVYNKNGHGTQNTPPNQTCTYGQEIYLADSLSETGWWFDGWIIAGEPYLGGDTITCTEEYLGVMGGATMTTVNVTANWLPWCNKITLATHSNDATWPSGSITALYAKTRESGSTTDGKWYKDNGCTTEYTSADYAKVIPTRSGWAFRGFYADSNNAADVSATQTNGVEQHIDHTGVPTSTGQTFINGLNANTVLYAGWARNCTNPVAHGTCSRTIGQNTTYTTTCATGYHYDPTASESTYNPICVPNTITIILNKNGGTGTCGGQSGTTSGTLTCNYDGTCNTPVWGNTCAIAKTGKIFAGWSTTADESGAQSCGTTGTQSCGTATVAGDVQNINDGTTTTTLYAVWQDVVCNVTNGSAAVSVSDNTVACAVTCNNGYESNGIYTGQQHATSVTTGQCNKATYDINYHYDAEHGGALASLLPEGYTQLEYVTANGRQYFDTGVVLTNTSNIENVMEIQATSFSGFQTWTGFMKTSATTPRYGINFYNNKWMVGINATSSNGVTADSGRHIVKFVTTNNAQILYDTDGTTELARSSLDANALSGNVLPLYIGARNNSGTPVNFVNGNIGRIYLKQNGVELYHYIPVQRDEDDAVGFYDTVSGEFLRSATANDFVAGPVVTVEYPESYTYGTGAAVYGGATRANSVFEGWCRNAALTDGCTMVPHVIGTTEYGDKDLYAKWSCVNGYHLDGNNQCVGNTITINYQNGGHGGTPNPLQHTCVYGATRNLAGAMGEVGYAFIGWGINNEVYDASENITCDYDTLGVYGGTIDSGTVIAEAQWDTVEYVVTYDCNTTWSNPTPEPQYIRTGGTFRTRQNTCQNPGYQFVKWAVSGTSPQEYKNENEQFTWGYTENKIFSAVWERDNTNVFTVTVDMPANTAFKFTTIATGQFWVDWDDGSNIEEYAPTTITTKTWTHTYTTAGTYVIKIGGRATGYAISTNGTPERKSAISFFNGTLSSTSIDATVTANGTEQYITAVSGKLGNIFPTISAGTYGGQPRFYRTFKNTSAMNITLQSVEDLFDGLSGTPVPYMFAETFDGSAVTGTIPAGLLPVSGAPKTALFLSTFRNCAGLTGTIPANLFVNISGAPATQMFSRTFRGCDGLTGIPAGLFRNISGAPAEAMFYATFLGCTNITGTLSSNLFGSLNGPVAKDMFRSTFYNCISLVGDTSNSTVAIPNGMFGTLGASTADATYAFYNTFSGCNALSGIIGGALFGGLTGAPAEHMFESTFYGCSSLSGSIPQNLFGNMTGAHAASMFAATFQNCAGLTGPIPTGLFGTPTGAPAASMFKTTFSGCTSLTGAIPSGLFGNISGAPANDMFYGTFYDTAITGTIPANLFRGNGTGISGAPAENMFRSTFNGCSGLTGEIPNYLFGYISGEAASNMFRATFYNCSGLTGTIPENLFGGQNLTGTAKTYMFYYTFYGCGGLTGYVPEGLFGGVTVPSSVPSGMMTYVFADSGLLTECPCGTTDISAESPFYTYWRSTSASANPKKVSCRVGLKPGEHWYNGICTTECSDTAIDELHVGNLDPYLVLADPVSTVKNLAVKHNDTVCYVPVASGNGGTNSLNMKYGNTVYHADRPNDTPPAGFGQR